MKVYLLIYLSVTYDDVFSSTPEVYATKESAMKAFEDEKESVKENYPDWNVKVSTDQKFILSDSDFSGFIEIRIEECEVK